MHHIRRIGKQVQELTTEELPWEEFEIVVSINHAQLEYVRRSTHVFWEGEEITIKSIDGPDGQPKFLPRWYWRVEYTNREYPEFYTDSDISELAGFNWDLAKKALVWEEQE